MRTFLFFKFSFSLVLTFLIFACNIVLAETKAISPSLYGNWCGINHPLDINTAEDPIDLLDANCKTHDLCYLEQGQFACSCDKKLIDELGKNLLAGSYQGEEARIARSFRHYFKGSPCKGKPEGKLPPTQVLQHVYSGAASRATGLYHHVIKPKTDQETSSAHSTSAQASSADRSSE